MINLFINYYDIPNKERQEELDYCLRKNIDNPLIDMIYIFLDKNIKFIFNSDKVHLINLSRPTYSDIIKYINSKKEFEDSYNIISNTDLYFDKSILLLDRISMKDTCVVLNRWNVQKDGSSIFLETKGSQDVWIFKGKIKEELIKISNFYLGKRCCDNVFLNNLCITEYRTVCPSYDIVAHHLHNVDFRTWKWGVDEIKGTHMYINLCKIEDLEDGKPVIDYYDTSTLDEQAPIKNNINLFINYYVSPNRERQREIDECFRRNCDSKVINKIYVFCDKKIRPRSYSKKITFIDLKRATYADIIYYINSNAKFYHSYNVISNSDIYFDESLFLLEKINMFNTCVSLTRWNIQPNGQLRFNKTIGSQDVWIFKGPINKKLELCSNFNFGVQCCDTVFMNNLYECEFRTINPSNDIKAYHLHNVNFRAWTWENRNKGKEMYLNHCRLEDVTTNKPFKSWYYIDKKVKTNLFVQYYPEVNSLRARELKFCLEENMKNINIDITYIFSEVYTDFQEEGYRGDTVIIKLGRRPTFKDIVEYINSKEELKYSYNIIANSDIFFDDSLKLLDKIDFTKKTCVALTRHESNESKKIIRFREDKYIGCSQDVWIFKGDIDINLNDINFYFGIPGCDNRFTYELDRRGYRLLNPCKDIIIYHYHQNRLPRTNEKVPGPYKNLTLTKLGDLNERNLVSWNQ